jgi:hypothetical protein
MLLIKALLVIGLQEFQVLRKALWSSMMYTTLPSQKQVTQALLQHADKLNETDQ